MIEKGSQPICTKSMTGQWLKEETYALKDNAASWKTNSTDLSKSVKSEAINDGVG
jgi:hypothetical protein